MRTFAIGDVQGCYRELQQLLSKVGYVSGHDRLWFVGDLVNRGPASADVVRFVRDLGDSAVCVLGNHDLHLMAIAYGYAKPRKKDTLNELLAAPDAGDLIDWFHDRPIYFEDASLNAVLVHAGIYPGWSLEQAAVLSTEVTEPLQRRNAEKVFSAMYGNEPIRWHNDLTGQHRTRFIINAFTRMRLVSQDLALEFTSKGPPDQSSENLLQPWFRHQYHNVSGRRIVFGHWSALGAGIFGNCISLDSGCVWGNALTAVRLDTVQCEFTSTDCKQRDTI